MAIRFRCVLCGANFSAPDEEAGHSFSCPGCGVQVQVPDSEVALAPVSDPLEETESAGIAETQVAPVPEIPKPKTPRSPPREGPPPGNPPAAAEKTRVSVAPKDQDPAKRERLESTNVKIVDVDVPLRSVLRMAVRFSVAGALVALVLLTIAGAVTAALWAAGFKLLGS